MSLRYAFLLAATCVVAAGCQEKKETVVDIDTPMGNVEVTKDPSDGAVEVNVDASPAEEAPAGEETPATTDQP